MGTEVNPEGNQQAGQAQGNQQGQPAPQTNQATEVEVRPGEKVTLDELKSGYMKDADYRRKTAELAEERRRLEAERQRLAQERSTPQFRNPYLAGRDMETPDDEEPDPMQVLAHEVVGLKAFIANNYLTGQIDRLAEKYPEADKEAVHRACWTNPHANIEEEMRASHERIASKISRVKEEVKVPTTLDEFFAANPQAKAEYENRVKSDKTRAIDEYNAKKRQSTGVAGASGGAGTSQSFSEPEEKPVSYRDATKRLAERLKTEDGADL